MIRSYPAFVSTPTTANRQPAYIVPVSVGTVNGGIIGGRIRPFSPNLPNLILEEGSALRQDGDQAKRIHIAAERIAYVAFHRQEGAPRPQIMFTDPEELRVHVGGSQVFDVVVSASRIDHLLGFFAFPCDDASPYESFYFYASGVNAKENATALGELLVRVGALNATEVDNGLARQEIDRKIPIGEILIQQNKVSTEQMEEAALVQSRRRLRIGEVLVEQGLAKEEDIEAALEAQRRHRGKRIGEVLVELGVVSEIALFRVLARKFHMPFIDLGEVDINPEAARTITPETIRKFRVMPLDVTATTLTVAIKDPLNTEVHDVLRFQFKGRVQEVLAMPSQLERFVEAFFEVKRDDDAVVEDSEEIKEILAMLSAEADEYTEENRTPYTAAETITRLLDMDLDPFSFGDALLGVMAQRLARRLCSKCRVQYPADDADYTLVVEAFGEERMARSLGITSRDQLMLWRGQGCDRCGGTGYRGRVAIHEFLVVNDAIKNAVQARATAERIKELALQGGMTTLLMDGIEKSVQGKTTLDKVLAVCNA